MQAGGNTVVSGLKENEFISSLGSQVSDATKDLTKAVDTGIGKLKSIFGGTKK